MASTMPRFRQCRNAGEFQGPGLTRHLFSASTITDCLLSLSTWTTSKTFETSSRQVPRSRDNTIPAEEQHGRSDSATFARSREGRADCQATRRGRDMARDPSDLWPDETAGAIRLSACQTGGTARPAKITISAHHDASIFALPPPNCLQVVSCGVMGTPKSEGEND